MSSRQDKTIEALLREKRVFPPPNACVAQANVRSASVYKKADRNFQRFWDRFAKELDWFKPWTKVLDWRRSGAPRRPWGAATTLRTMSLILGAAGGGNQ